MITTRHLALLVATCVLAATPVRAQCLEWREGFGSPTGGANGPVYAEIVFDDGSGPALYIGGDFTAVAGAICRNFARWDGTRWTGLLDEVDGDIFAFAVYDDGAGPRLYASGSFTTIGGTPAARIAKWTGSGFVAIGNINNAVNEMLPFDDGSGPKLYVTGIFTNADGVVTNGAARWDGSSWSAMNLGAGGRGYALGVYDDGGGADLYIGGNFSIPLAGGAATNVARWDGTTFSRLGTGVGSSSQGVNHFEVFAGPSGPELHAGGTFTTAGGIPASRIARWNGTSWGALPGTINSAIFSMLAHDDGSGPSLFICGPFETVNGMPAPRIARWNGTVWSGVGGGCDDTVNALAQFDEGSGPRLFVAGEFRNSGGTTTPSIARWDGAWSTVGPGNGLSFDVNDLQIHDDGSGSALYAAGGYTQGTVANPGPVVRWTGTQWATVGPPLTNGYAYQLDTYDNGAGPQLYATGGFPSLGTTAVRWDGSVWTRLGSGPNGQINATAVFDDGNGPDLYCGGNWQFVDGIGMPRIARWNASGWSWPNNIWPEGIVEAMAVYDDGTGPELYIGGNFTNISSWGPANNIVKWDGTNWSTVGTGMNGIVTTLHVFDDGSGSKLYASGGFTTAGGVTVPSCARWDGTSWSALPWTFDAPPRVWAFHDDGSGTALHVAGEFTTIDGIPAPRLARLKGGVWSGIGGGVRIYPQNVAGRIDALASFDDGTGNGSDLWVAGTFDAAGTVRSKNVAAWEGCVGTSGTYCHGDGTGTPCPCGNVSLPAGFAGCLNSLGTGGRLVGSGTPSIAADTFVLQGSGMPSASALYFQGTTEANGGNGVAFGDGLRCAGGSVARLKTVTNAGGASQFPAGGDPSISVQGSVISPGSRTYQVWYRNAATFCTSATFNLTNGVKCVWTP